MELAHFVVQVFAREPGLPVVDAGWGKDWLAQLGRIFALFHKFLDVSETRTVPSEMVFLFTG